MKDLKLSIGVNMKVGNADLVVFDDGRVLRKGYTAPNGWKLDDQFLTLSNRGNGYLAIKTVGSGPQKVHRLVAKAFLPDYTEELTVDHINGDKSDNRIENLRMLSHKQNMRSYQKARGGSSKYRGVTRRKEGGSWVAQINVDGNVCRLGSFPNERDAALAYNDAAKRAGFSKEALNIVE